MQHYGIRAGSLAITKNGKLLLSHAYTWAQPDYPKTTHTTAFRLGSVSKLLCYIAVMQLWDEGLLSPSGLHSLMQAPNMLALKALDGTEPAASNPWWGQIQLTHLMRHLTGWLLWTKVPPGDPWFPVIDFIWGGGFAERDDIRDSAGAYPNPPPLSWPLPLETLNRFFVTMSGALDHPPGTSDWYSNVDPVFLAQLVQKKDLKKLPLHQYLPTKVFDRIGVPKGRTYSLGYDEHVWGQRPANQARFHAAVPWVVFSLVAPDLAPGMPVLVPSPYANNWLTQTAPGGYVASSVDMARVLAALERVDLFNQPGSPVLMSPAARAEMWSNPHDGFEVTAGGWFIERPWGPNQSDPHLLQHNGLVAGGVSLLVRGVHGTGTPIWTPLGPTDGLGIVLQFNQDIPEGPDPQGIYQDNGLHAGNHGAVLMELAAEVEAGGGWPHAEDLFQYVDIPPYP